MKTIMEYKTKLGEKKAKEEIENLMETRVG